jgi:hypothetical protein
MVYYMVAALFLPIILPRLGKQSPCDFADLAFVGVWEHWRAPNGELDSYAIITIEANELTV